MPERFHDIVGTQVAPPSPTLPGNTVGPMHHNDDWSSIAAASRCWAQSGDAFFPVTEVVPSIPPGAYRCRQSNRGPYLEKMPIELDRLLTLPDSSAERLLAEFRKFWTLRKNFSERGFTFKRGLLLWGPPGSGKTSAIWQMTQELVSAQSGVVIFVENPELSSVCVGILRRIESERPIICIMEDIDALVREYGSHGFLAMLDGETQISNVVHIATTNYPELLDRRFVDRPSRFDTVMLIGMPTAAARSAYIVAKEPKLDDVTLRRWVQRSDGYSIAHLREVIIAIKCFEQEEDDVFTRMDEMRDNAPSSDGAGALRRTAGFGGRHG